VFFFFTNEYALLDKVKAALAANGFQMDQGKTEVAWIFASEKPGKKQREKAESWHLKWQGLTRKFDIKAKPTRWLGFFIDCRLDWKAHVRHRLALGHHRLGTISGIMTANGIPRRLARKVAWAVAMSIAAYGVEAIWEGQEWLLKDFNKLTTAIGRTVAGTFSTQGRRRSRHPTDPPHARPQTGTTTCGSPVSAGRHSQKGPPPSTTGRRLQPETGFPVVFGGNGQRKTHQRGPGSREHLPLPQATDTLVATLVPEDHMPRLDRRLLSQNSWLRMVRHPRRRGPRTCHRQWLHILGTPSDRLRRRG